MAQDSKTTASAVPSRQSLLTLALVAAAGAVASAVGLAGPDEELPDLLYLGGLIAAVCALGAVISSAERRRRELCAARALARRITRLQRIFRYQVPEAEKQAQKQLDEADARLATLAGRGACDEILELEAARDELKRTLEHYRRTSSPGGGA